MLAPSELLWAFIGLMLTILGTWMETFTLNPGWLWRHGGSEVLSLGVSFQVGAVLLTGCVGGKNAAALAQMAYLVLGLALFQVFGLPVFTQGGGLSYLREPGFGYLLGFVPAGWLTGYLAFLWPLSLETLAVPLGWLQGASAAYGETLFNYSILAIPGHLVVVCAVAVLSLALRRALFY
jgi:biotin transport system substrate-specific component